MQSMGRGVLFQDRTAFRSERFVLVAIKQSNQEKPHVYRPSILTFVDILGFREIAQKGKPEDIKELLESLKREATPDDNLAKDLEMSFLTFSVCTVRVVPVDSRSNKKFPSGILWHELLSLVYLQARLVRKKCFIRGGLTVDDIYIDGNMVFGPAIIKAYMLESEFAVYPRIVVDPAVFPLFEKDQLLRNHDTATEWEYLQKVIRRDSDGLYFVDYISGILTEFDEEGMEFDFLAAHKEVVLESARAHDGLNKVAAKYLWLANYHNTVVNEISSREYDRHGLKRENYIITTEELPMLYERR